MRLPVSMPVKFTVKVSLLSRAMLSVSNVKLMLVMVGSLAWNVRGGAARVISSGPACVINHAFMELKLLHALYRVCVVYVGIKALILNLAIIGHCHFDISHSIINLFM